MSSVGIVSRWVISLVIVLNLELILVASATIASLLVPPYFCLMLMIDHMSRDCPNPRTNNVHAQERRTERDTLTGIPIRNRN
jgi:hypothetical protein